MTKEVLLGFVVLDFSVLALVRAMDAAIVPSNNSAVCLSHLVPIKLRPQQLK